MDLMDAEAATARVGLPSPTVSDAAVFELTP
jgi:hypothetical protein